MKTTTEFEYVEERMEEDRRAKLAKMRRDQVNDSLRVISDTVRQQTHKLHPEDQVEVLERVSRRARLRAEAQRALNEEKGVPD